MIRAVHAHAVLSLCLLLSAVNSFAQQRPHVAAPHRPIAPRVEKLVKELRVPTRRTMVGGLWMTDANWKSSLYLRNSVETDPIEVTPILYLANGKRYPLAPVTIEPAGNVIIDINDALQKQGISSWATLSGYVELEYNWAWDPFCATVRDIDTAHSLIFSYSLRPTLPTPIQVKQGTPVKVPPAVEGMWWKQESNVTGFVSVANLTGQAAKTSIQTTDNLGNIIEQHDFTVSPHGMKVINLTELLSSTAFGGGIRVMSSQPMDQLIVSGGLEDQGTGYSVAIPFTAPQKLELPNQPTQVEIAALGIMTGPADSMMAFPAGTTFTPYSVLRNASESPTSLVPTLWWMEGGSPHSAQLPQITVPAHETVNMDVVLLLAQYGPKNFSGSFNLVFDADLGTADLLMSAGSVDQTNNYVFETVPRGVAESTAKALQYWSIGNGDDTMITVWNPADEPQNFVLTLFFSGGQYALPLYLEPRATRSLNVSELVQNQVPDASGNIIPASVHEGSAVISGSRAENEAILVAIDSGVYNVKKATCSNYCTYCYGYNNSQVVVDGVVLPTGGNAQEHLYAQYNSGGQYDFTGGTSQWNSTATNVATVSAGLVHGQSIGSASISAVAGPVTMNEGYICFGPNPIPCPMGYVGGSAGAYIGPYRVEPVSTIVQGTFPPGECPTGGPDPGYLRAVNNQVQYFNGAGYLYSVTAADIIVVGSRHDLGSGTSTGSVQTEPDGTFYDGYSICSTACPGSSGETDALQSWTVNGVALPHANAIVYKCNSITIDGF